jgi:hypothetical protein
MQVHLGSVSHVDDLVLKYPAEDITIHAEVSLLEKAGVLDELHDSCAGSGILFSVVTIDRVFVSSKNDHFFSVYSNGDGWLLDVEHRLSDYERGPLLDSQALYVVYISLIKLVRFLQFKNEKLQVAITSSFWISTSTAWHQINSLIVHHHSRSGISWSLNRSHFKPNAFHYIEPFTG